MCRSHGGGYYFYTYINDRFRRLDRIHFFLSFFLYFQFIFRIKINDCTIINYLYSYPVVLNDLCVTSRNALAPVLISLYDSP